MNSETTHTQAKQQYFELRIALNKSNKVKDLKSELEFELRENNEEFFIIIRSSQAEHGLRIARYVKNHSGWMIYKNHIYQEFYNYMFKKIFLLKPVNNLNINNELTGWLLRLWIIQVKN
jgi:hypothetical protein